MRNRRWLLNERPIGRPVATSDFRRDEADVPEPGEGEVLVRVRHLGFDPAQKGWMENVTDYLEPTVIGEPMRAHGIGEVVTSRAAGFPPGDIVSGFVGWQDYAVLPAAKLEKIEEGEPTHHLGVLGLPGLTAYFGLHKIGRPFPGDTVVVTGAGGAVGSIVGQVAKIAGCRVIGVAGGEEKCRWLVDELGFDAAVDHRAGPVRKQMRAVAPDGIDLLWDNVGGKTFDNLLPLIAMHARVVVCGASAIYSETTLPPGPSHYMNLVFRRARMEGLLVLDYESEFPSARKRMVRWLEEGRLVARESVAHGLDAAPETLVRLFDGAHLGKQILTLESD